MKEIKNTAAPQVAEKSTEQRHQNPAVTADVVAFSIGKGKRETYRKLPKSRLQLLLVRRGHAPFAGAWALPGGFLEPGETLRQAAARELAEETGLSPGYLEQLHTWSDVERDPRGRVISTSYLAVVNEQGKRVRAGDDAAEACWFDLAGHVEYREERRRRDGALQQVWLQQLDLRAGTENLSALVRVSRIQKGMQMQVSREIVEQKGLAFDHAAIIANGMEEFRRRVRHTDLMFYLMPEFFTLTELQQAYEAVLGEKVSRASFRRAIAPRVVETEQYVTRGGHRPSQLYMFDPLRLQAAEEEEIDPWR